jgi:hypothetical protein
MKQKLLVQSYLLQFLSQSTNLCQRNSGREVLQKQSLAEEEFLIFRALLHVSLDLRKQVAVLLSFAARTRGTIRTLRGGLLWSSQIWLLMVAWRGGRVLVTSIEG